MPDSCTHHTESPAAFLLDRFSHLSGLNCFVHSSQISGAVPPLCPFWYLKDREARMVGVFSLDRAGRTYVGLQAVYLMEGKKVCLWSEEKQRTWALPLGATKLGGHPASLGKVRSLGVLLTIALLCLYMYTDLYVFIYYTYICMY